jgi:hypothetical protein
MPNAGETRATRSMPSLRPFEERAPWEAGFAVIFERDMAPVVAELERFRLRRRRHVLICYVGAALALGVGLALFRLGFVLDPPELVLEIMAGVVLACLCLAWYLPTSVAPALRRDYRDRVVPTLLPPLLGFLGADRHAAAPKPEELPSLAALHRLGLIGSPNEWRLGDVVSGRDAGLAWDIVEIVARKRSPSALRRVLSLGATLPRGAVARIDRPGGTGPFALLHAPGLAPATQLPRSAHQITLDGSPLAGGAVAWAENDDALVACVPRNSVLSLRAWIENLGGRPWLIAFSSGNLLLLLPAGKDPLVSKGVFRSLIGIERDVHTLLAGLTVPRRLIAALRGDVE